MPSTESDKPKPKDWWDKAQILLLPIVTVGVGVMLNGSIQDRANKVKMVELAVEILKSDPKASVNAYHIRGWALDVIQKNSEVPFPAEALEGLRKSALELIKPPPATNVTVH